MTQRSIQTGPTPQVIVRAGGAVTVTGEAGDRVLANTTSRWGLKVERRGETTQVEIGGSGEVHVPLGSSVKVYAGKGADVYNIQGSVTIYAGGHARTRGIQTLVHASAGGDMDLECERLEGDTVEFSSGRDLRCYVRSLADATLMINDLGGYWQGVIGGGRVKLRLKAGGDVTIVTPHAVMAQPPHYVLGKIERPAEDGSLTG